MKHDLLPRFRFLCAVSINGEPPVVWPARSEADALHQLYVAALFAEGGNDVYAYTVALTVNRTGEYGQYELWKDADGRSAGDVIRQMIVECAGAEFVEWHATD